MIRFSLPPPVLCCYPLWFLAIKSTFHICPILSKLEWNLQNEPVILSFSGPSSRSWWVSIAVWLITRVYLHRKWFLISCSTKVYLELWTDITLEYWRCRSVTYLCHSFLNCLRLCCLLVMRSWIFLLPSFSSCGLCFNKWPYIKKL